MALELNKIRSAQINEKVYKGDASNPVPAYDIVLPESRADLIKETFGAKADLWAANTLYKVGQNVYVVDNAGAIASYECIYEHTSGNAFSVNVNGNDAWRLIVSRRFVTPADEANWKDGAKALKYKGVYDQSVKYVANDLVLFKNATAGKEEYFIALQDTEGVAPSLDGNTSVWQNLNLWANHADVADKVKVSAAGAFVDDADSVLLTFVTENGNQANLSTDAKLVYEVNSNYLHTMSEYADKYMRSFDNNGEVAEPAAKSLNDEFKAIYAAIKTISGGDLVLGHGLTIKLNGETLLDNWMAQEDGIINIELNSKDIKDWSTKLDEEFENRADTKYVRYDEEQGLTPEQQERARQNINAAPVADYVVKGADGKIDINDLPDTVVGGLQYKGIYDASVAGSIKPEMGDYYIVSVAGNYDPAGGVHAAVNPELNYFLVGDWAIYNGAEQGWAKIDNTDAVKTVNGQIGAVKTYKGVYSEEADYYAGDWVLVNGILYLAVQNSKGQSVEDEAYWQVAGRIYEGEKGIAINGNKIGHTNVLTREDEIAETSVAAKGGQFSVDINEYDEQGHVVKTQKQNITLSQTWREVKVGDTVVVAKDSDEALNVVGNAPINVSGSNHAIYVEHAAGVEVKDAIELTVESAGEVVANIVKSDSFGHVNGTRELKLANLAVKDGDQNLTGVKTLSTVDGQNGAVILPGATEKYDLGSESAKFNGIYAKEFKGNLIGNADTASKWAEARQFSISINSGMGGQKNDTPLVSEVISRKVDGSSDRAWEVTLAKSGVKAGAYTAVRVNEQGIVTGGAQAIEFGETVNVGPSDALVYGGLFFRMIESD